MASRNDITEAWKQALVACGWEDPGTCYKPTPEQAAELGEQLWDYMTASIYDMDWEGFSAAELRGVKAFITDFMICTKANQRARGERK